MSRLPIHQDGSCNGLQHYAALGRDEAGAIAVNVKPSVRPQDVYTGVLNIVLVKIESDMAIPDDDPDENRLVEILAHPLFVISPLLPPTAISHDEPVS